jgi:hypothetical protein
LHIFCGVAASSTYPLRQRVPHLTPRHPTPPLATPPPGMEYAESRSSYLRHILSSLQAGAIPLYQAGYPLAAFMAWQHQHVHVAQIVAGVLAHGVREEELPLLTELLWETLPMMQRTCSGSLLQGARARGRPLRLAGPLGSRRPRRSGAVTNAGGPEPCCVRPNSHGCLAPGAPLAPAPHRVQPEASGQGHPAGPTNGRRARGDAVRRSAWGGR